MNKIYEKLLVNNNLNYSGGWQGEEKIKKFEKKLDTTISETYKEFLSRIGTFSSKKNSVEIYGLGGKKIKGAVDNNLMPVYELDIEREIESLFLWDKRLFKNAKFIPFYSMGNGDYLIINLHKYNPKTKEASVEYFKHEVLHKYEGKKVDFSKRNGITMETGFNSFGEWLEQLVEGDFEVPLSKKGFEFEEFEEEEWMSLKKIKYKFYRNNLDKPAFKLNDDFKMFLKFNSIKYDDLQKIVGELKKVRNGEKEKFDFRHEDIKIEFRLDETVIKYNNENKIITEEVNPENIYYLMERWNDYIKKWKREKTLMTEKNILIEKLLGSNDFLDIHKWEINDIEEYEKEKDIILPYSYKQFLVKIGIFNFEKKLVKLFGLFKEKEKIEGEKITNFDFRKRIKKVLEVDKKVFGYSNFIPFFEVGDGDYLVLNLDKYNPITKEAPVEYFDLKSVKKYRGIEVDFAVRNHIFKETGYESFSDWLKDLINNNFKAPLKKKGFDIEASMEKEYLYDKIRYYLQKISEAKNLEELEYFSVVFLGLKSDLDFKYFFRDYESENINGEKEEFLNRYIGLDGYDDIEKDIISVIKNIQEEYIVDDSEINNFFIKKKGLFRKIENRKDVIVSIKKGKKIRKKVFFVSYFLSFILLIQNIFGLIINFFDKDSFKYYNDIKKILEKTNDMMYPIGNYENFIIYNFIFIFFLLYLMEKMKKGAKKKEKGFIVIILMFISLFIIFNTAIFIALLAIGIGVMLLIPHSESKNLDNDSKKHDNNFIIEYDKNKSYITNSRFTNEFLGIIDEHYFSIIIKINTLKKKNEEKKNSDIDLDFIKIKIDKIDDLYNKKWVFPINPEEGYIDGSIYDGYYHAEVDVVSLLFRKINDKKMTVEITGTMSFKETLDEFLVTNKYNFKEEFIIKNKIDQKLFL